MNKKQLKILKIVIISLTALAFIGLIYHFIRGIALSLHDNDVKTAQNRVNSAYQFLMMILAGLVTIGGLTGTFAIKVNVLPKCIDKFFNIETEEPKQEESKEEVEEELAA